MPSGRESDVGGRGGAGLVIHDAEWPDGVVPLGSFSSCAAGVFQVSSGPEKSDCLDVHSVAIFLQLPYCRTAPSQWGLEGQFSPVGVLACVQVKQMSSQMRRDMTMRNVATTIPGANKTRSYQADCSNSIVRSCEEATRYYSALSSVHAPLERKVYHDRERIILNIFN